jgi:ubiquinone/menaquinone biosynthesis C-methylase UbiE
VRELRNKGVDVFDYARLQNQNNLTRVVRTLLSVWPEHNDYCTARFKDDTPDFLRRMDEVAGLALRLAGEELDQYCSDYRWMCEEFIKEELFFRREGHYRLSTFKEAYDDVYSKQEYMGRYVRGILISQLIWKPHAQAFDFFRTRYLTSFQDPTNYLEVGPGHGLFLYFASQQRNAKYLEAWDISKSSIAATTHSLTTLGVDRKINLFEHDVMAAPLKPNYFDRASISEVLEHLERPDLALRALHSNLRPGGRIFINVPINSPAPDHIYLWTSIKDFTQFVEAQGFEIEESLSLPVTGYSLDQAIRRNLSISCVLIAKRPA